MSALLVRLHDLSTIFISIVLQSLPFVLIGVFAAAAAALYLPAHLLERWLARRSTFSVLLAGLAGLVIPVCDCGVIPLTRRLLAKGLPPHVGVTLILAAPVVNPLVAASTALAFQGNGLLVALRLGMSLSVAVLIGLLARKLSPWLEPKPGVASASVGPPFLVESAALSPTLGDRLSLVGRASAEFFEVIFFVLLGGLVTAGVQTFVPRALLNGVGGDQVLSIAVLMPLATILSICSEADAFVARALASAFSPGSLLAFLVIGQIVDLRNGPLLLRTLGRRYVVVIVITSYLLVFLEALVVNRLVPRL